MKDFDIRNYQGCFPNEELFRYPKLLPFETLKCSPMKLLDTMRH